MGRFKASATTTPEGADVASTVTGASAADNITAGTATTVLHFVKTDGTEANVIVDLSAATTAAAKKTAINTALGGTSDITATLDGGATG
jgi:hypothetical protein